MNGFINVYYNCKFYSKDDAVTRSVKSVLDFLDPPTLPSVCIKLQCQCELLFVNA